MSSYHYTRIGWACVCVCTPEARGFRWTFSKKSVNPRIYWFVPTILDRCNFICVYVETNPSLWSGHYSWLHLKCGDQISPSPNEVWIEIANRFPLSKNLKWMNVTCGNFDQRVAGLLAVCPRSLSQHAFNWTLWGNFIFGYLCPCIQHLV